MFRLRKPRKAADQRFMTSRMVSVVTQQTLRTVTKKQRSKMHDRRTRHAGPIYRYISSDILVQIGSSTASSGVLYTTDFIHVTAEHHRHHM